VELELRELAGRPPPFALNVRRSYRTEVRANVTVTVDRIGEA
jgi:hypothetical protein